MSGSEQPLGTGAQATSAGKEAVQPEGGAASGRAAGVEVAPGVSAGNVTGVPTGGANASPGETAGKVLTTQTYLFVHAIWVVRQREALLSRPVRRVLFTHLQKESEEKGMRVVAVGGVEDHLHCLLQLMPSQNLLQVMRTLRAFAANWINESRLLAIPGEFAWEEGYAAYSVSPSGVKQVVDYIGKQEEYHKSKNLDSELEIIDRFKDAL